MLSRLPGHDGKDQNTPLVQFGNLAMMPLEPEYVDQGSRFIFVSEMHSRTGFSGSPVFVFRTELDFDESIKTFEEFRKYAIYGRIKLRIGEMRLLGMHVEQFRITVPQDPKDKIPDIYQLTSLNKVIPAWKIEEMLMADEMKQIRKEQDVRDGLYIADPNLSQKESAPQDFTQPDFDSALRKVSQQIPPSEPASET
jgi:hypothetical protein